MRRGRQKKNGNDEIKPFNSNTPYYLRIFFHSSNRRYKGMDELTKYTPDGKHTTPETESVTLILH